MLNFNNTRVVDTSGATERTSDGALKFNKSGAVFCSTNVHYRLGGNPNGAIYIAFCKRVNGAVSSVIYNRAYISHNTTGTLSIPSTLIKVSAGEEVCVIGVSTGEATITLAEDRTRESNQLNYMFFAG